MDADDGEEAPPALRRAFWRLVFVFNVALLAAALGAMLIGFEGNVQQGGGLLVVGTGTFLYGLWRYRYERRHGAAAPEK